MEMEQRKKEEQEHVHQAEWDGPWCTCCIQKLIYQIRDETPEEHHDEEHAADYSHYSKQQLAELIKDLSSDDNFKKVDNILREIKPLYRRSPRKRTGRSPS